MSCYRIVPGYPYLLQKPFYFSCRRLDSGLASLSVLPASPGLPSPPLPWRVPSGHLFSPLILALLGTSSFLTLRIRAVCPHAAALEVSPSLLPEASSRISVLCTEIPSSTAWLLGHPWAWHYNSTGFYGEPSRQSTPCPVASGLYLHIIRCHVNHIASWDISETGDSYSPLPDTRSYQHWYSSLGISNKVTSLSYIPARTNICKTWVPFTELKNVNKYRKLDYHLSTPIFCRDFL